MKITIELNREEFDMAIDSGALKALSMTMKKSEAINTAVPVKATKVVPDDKAAEEITKNTVQTSATESEPKITKEMVRAVFTSVIKAGKAAEAKALTAKYGAKKVPDLKEEDYAAVYKEANILLEG